MNASTITNTNTVVTNASNRLAVVTVTGYTGATRTVTGITLGAQSFTQGANIGRQGIDYNWTDIWYLIAPTVGTTATLTVTFSGSTTGKYCTFTTFSDVKQTTQPDVSSTDSGAGDNQPQLISLATTTYGCLIYDLFNSDAGSGTAYTGLTNIGNGASYRIVTDTSTYSVGRTAGFGDSYVHSSMAFKTATLPTSSGGLLGIL